jgi:hypothetical protein
VGLRVLKVALVVDPDGVITAFGLAPAASDERPIGEALIAEDLHEAYLLAYPRASRGRVGETLVGALRGYGGCHPEGQHPQGMVEGRSAMG